MWTPGGFLQTSMSCVWWDRAITNKYPVIQETDSLDLLKKVTLSQKETNYLFLKPFFFVVFFG